MASETLAYINHDILTWAREQRSYSLRDAAGSVGVTPSTWNGWESGATLPTWEEAHAIADALGFSFNYLWLPERPDAYPASAADLEDRRIKDAVRRTLEGHATCLEDAGDSPMVEWNCDLLVIATVLERQRATDDGARGGDER